MASVWYRTSKLLAKPREEAATVRSTDAVSAKPTDRLIACRKGIMTLRHVLSWIKGKMPKGFNLRSDPRTLVSPTASLSKPSSRGREPPAQTQDDHVCG
jgi:hypothetical protein